MSPARAPSRVDLTASALLLATFAAAGAFDGAGPVIGILLGALGAAGAILLRMLPSDVPPALVPAPALLMLAIVAARDPPAAVTELLVAAAALALLYWNGSDARTAATGRDRARALALPTLATVVAVMIPLVVPTVPSSLGIGAAALLLVLVLVAAGAYLAQPSSLARSAPSS